MSGVSPTLYETQWESLRHKRINTPFVASKYSYLVDPTIQETEYPITNSWDSFKNQIEYPSCIDVNVSFSEHELTQLYGGTEYIKEDDPSLNSSHVYVSFLSDIHGVIDHEINVNIHRKMYQSQIDNLSYIDANVHIQNPELAQLYGEPEQTKEDVCGSISHNTHNKLLSDVNVVLAHVETGSNYRETYQRQDDIESDVVFPGHESSQLLDDAVKIKEYTHGSYLHCSIMTHLSDADVVLTYKKTGTAITDITELQKYQTEKQWFEVSEQFAILSQQEDNWDERGSPKPTDLTLAHAKKVIDASLNSIISDGYQCDTPFISSDGYGNITAVWYREERELHFQIGEQEAEYFRVWGTNIDTEMDVDFLKPEDYPSHWKWLIDEL